MIRRAVLTIAVLVAGASGAYAAAPVPTTAGWPCDTDPRPELTLHDYWPDAQTAANDAVDPAMEALVAEVAPRRLDQADAIARLHVFVAHSGAPGDRVRLANALVTAIDDERRVIIAGIRRFNTRQDQLAKRVEQGYATIDTPTPAPAGEGRQALEDQARWDQRIFEDRQKMLPIICRQPAALEARAAALVAAIRPASSK